MPIKVDIDPSKDPRHIPNASADLASAKPLAEG